VSARTVSLLILLAAVCTATAAGAAPPKPAPHAGGASPPDPAPPENGPNAGGSSVAVRIVYPDGRIVASPAASPDGQASASAESYAYPASGAVVVTGRVVAAAAAKIKKIAASTVSASASNVSLFNGEITASSVAAHASATGTGTRAGGELGGTAVSQLQALGRPHAFGRAKLGDWGYLVIAPRDATRATENGVKRYDGVSIGVAVHLTASHGGLPAGSVIELAYAEATAETSPPAIPAVGPAPADPPQLLPPVDQPLLGGVPQLIQPSLTAGPYIYPVYGPNSANDGYGIGKQDQTWQHGIEIFGGLGQPLVAVATGTLYAVGWNHAAGNRLWLRDRQGNTFLYAHLSAFSTLAANGAHVRAGQVIGFMGDTGNAAGLPTHLHFEVHPVSMLFLGADGAADPAGYLAKWRRMASLPFAVATGWAPKVPGTIKAPEPGAVPLASTDISTGSGLDPASLRRALRPPAGR
jgi:murein DD-endopeptidase MepM/ murein hydrolase activator NlpD